MTCSVSRRSCPTRWTTSWPDFPDTIPIGVGRDDGGRAGEFCPIFWNRDRFERIHAETLWLSPTPQEVGSIGWDAELPRIATVVVLHDRQTGKVFRLINAHFSHIGEVAREASARMLSMRMAGSSADVNLLMGDLNAEPGSPALDVLTAGRLADAHDVARKRCRQKIGTYTGFATTGLRGAPRIDHLLVDGGRSCGTAPRNASLMASTCRTTCRYTSP